MDAGTDRARRVIRWILEVSPGIEKLRFEAAGNTVAVFYRIDEAGKPTDAWSLGPEYNIKTVETERLKVLRRLAPMISDDLRVLRDVALVFEEILSNKET